MLRHADEFAATAKAGRRAARDLWRLTRDRRVSGPNERIVALDSVRIRALRRWIARCLADPRRLFAPSPVCGAWHLRFDVLLDRPALQRVVVERRGPDGMWKAIRARTLIEFRAAAARPRARLRREMSVPVEGPEAPLRIAARGLGRFGVSQVELTDGVQVRLARGWSARRPRYIGKNPPRSGFPRLDWERNTGLITLRFGG
jgi:hypothetical protein